MRWSTTDTWQTTWPPDDSGQVGIISVDAAAPHLLDLPKAIEVTLEHGQLGKLVWLFQMPQ